MKIISNNVFFAEVEQRVAMGESVKIPMKGYSMTPFLKSGKDCITLTAVQEVAWGDVLLFKYKGGYVLHRLIGIDGENLHLRGDGNIDKGEFVSREDVVAKLQSVERSSGKVVLTDTRAWRFRSRLWHRLFPIRRILLAIYRRVF